MPAYVYLAALAVIGGIGLLVYGLAGLKFPARDVRRNLAASGGRTTDLRELVLARPARERVVHPLMSSFSRLGRRLTPQGLLERLEHRLQLSGQLASWPVERLLAAKFAISLVFVLIGIALVAEGQVATGLLAAAVGGAAGFFLPDAILDGRAKSRQQQIARQLPDVIDQVMISVEAGLGFDAALARAGESGDGPLHDELAHMLQDVRLGMSRAVAFDKLLDRTDVPDLRHFVVAMGQADRHGVPIAQALRVQAAEVRDKRRARAEERGMKLPVKLVFPLVVCILPALFIVLVGPAALRIAHSPMFGAS
jgi:tight adherence protein C